MSRERLTQQASDGTWQVAAQTVQLAANGAACTGQAVEKLAKYETVHAQLHEKQTQIAAQLEALRAAGKQNTVQFKELVGNKLINTNLLAMLLAQGLE